MGVEPRGVAGTLFVHKIAGHLAESGAPLAEVAAAARAAAGDIRSLGLALTACAIPGQPHEARMGDDEAELGLGIHGEPGVEKIDLRDIAALVATMADRLGRLLPEGGADQALILNNLGAVPPIEMGVIANVIVGIVGAGLGGWLSGQLGLGGPPIMGWVMAVVGAAILIALLRAIGVFK